MLILLLFFAFVLFLVHQFWYRRLNYPHGPLPLPIIGNMHSLWYEERWENKFLDWKNKFGKIYTFYLGTVPVISVNDYQIAFDMFVKDGENFENRPSILDKFQISFRGGVYGIVNTSGDLWRKNRRFALRVLKDFGLGKNEMQTKILDEIQTICENVNKDIDSGIDEHDFHKHTDIASGSVINSIVCGYRFSADGNERQFYMLKQKLIEAMIISADPIFNMAIDNPFLSKLPVFKPRYDKILNLAAEIFKFIDDIIEDHLNQNDYNSEFEARDFIDAYLVEMHRREKSDESHYYSREQLRNVVLDLWFAGQETTSSTITWTIAYLIVNQDIQAKMHQEIDGIIGSDRMITLADKQNLPYCNAVIMESLRLSNIFPVNLLHAVGKDMEIAGRHVKKGTIIVAQISVMMSDPDNFEDPKKFNPSRFIDENGNFKPSEKLVAFSMGRRQCLGEGLARMELFLIIVNILNQFKLTASDVPPTLKRISSGMSPATESYKTRIQRRFK